VIGFQSSRPVVTPSPPKLSGPQSRSLRAALRTLRDESVFDIFEDTALSMQWRIVDSNQSALAGFGVQSNWLP
jgi:hypothetical protein